MANVSVKCGAWVRTGLALTAVAILAAGCERASAVASRGPAPRDAAGYDDRGGEDRGRSAARDENVRLIDGKPIWAGSRKGSAEENAQRSYDRNGRAFAARDLDDYVRKAQAFVEHPPEGVEKINRTNGDVLMYDAKTNVFAVANRAGTPKAMFKPDKGADYWRQQKDREQRYQSSHADRGGTQG